MDRASTVEDAWEDPSGDAAAVRVEDLSKRFDDVQALDGVSFSIRPGEFFGLLGPNGAGKTTTVRILATVTLPDSGSVRVLGRDPVREPAAVRGLIDLMTARDRFYRRISGWANLSFLCGLHGVPFDRERAAAHAERLGLDQAAMDRPVRTFSTGMVQKLNLVRGLLLDRPVLLLDEPSLGLDPVSARAYKDILTELLADGERTILFTSHNMYEVEELCDRVAILDRGRITAVGKPDELKATAFPNQELVLGYAADGGGPATASAGPSDPEDLRLPGVLSVRQEAAGLFVVELDGSADVDRVLRQAQRYGRLRTVHLREPTFEEAFVRHAGGDGGGGGGGGGDGDGAGGKEGEA